MSGAPGGQDGGRAPGGSSAAGTAVAVGAGLLGSAALIAGLTVLSRAVGFGRWFVFSGAVHQDCTGTAYATANVLPNVLFEVAAGGALAGAVVPVVAGALAAGRRQDVDRLVSALLTWCLVVLVPLAALLALASGPLSEVFLGGERACAGGTDLAARMLLVFAPQVPLYGIGVVLTGVLQAHRRFAWPAVAPLLSSVVVIVSYLGYAGLAGPARHAEETTCRPGAEAVLAGGTTLGVVALSLPLLWPVSRLGVRLRPGLRFPPGQAARVRGLALAGVGTLVAQQIAVLVTMRIANGVGGTGTWPVLLYVQAVYLLPYAVFAVPLATAAFPELSRSAETGDAEGFRRTSSRSTRLVVLVSALGAGSLVAVAPAVQALFGVLEGGTGGSLGLMSLALGLYAPGLVGWGLVAHVGRALYASGRGRSAAQATAAGWAAVVGVSLAVALVLDATGTSGTRAATIGVGVGNTAGMTLAGALLLLALRRVAGQGALQGLGRAGLASAVGAVLAAVAGRAAADATAPDPGTTPAGGAAGTALLAGGVAAVLAVIVFAAVVLVLDRADLVGLAGRGRARAGAGDRGDGEPAARPTAEVLLLLGTSGGGVGRHVRAVAEGLSAAGVPVGLAAPAGTAARFGLDGAGAWFTPVEIAARPHPLRDVRAVLRIRTLGSRVEVVHAHGLRAGALAVVGARLRGRARPAVVVTLHNALVGGGAVAVVHAVRSRSRGRHRAGGPADLGARQTAWGAVPGPRLPPGNRSRPGPGPGSGRATSGCWSPSPGGAQKGLGRSRTRWSCQHGKCEAPPHDAHATTTTRCKHSPRRRCVSAPPWWPPTPGGRRR